MIRAEHLDKRVVTAEELRFGDLELAHLKVRSPDEHMRHVRLMVMLAEYSLTDRQYTEEDIKPFLVFLASHPMDREVVHRLQRRGMLLTERPDADFNTTLMQRLGFFVPPHVGVDHRQCTDRTHRTVILWCLRISKVDRPLKYLCGLLEVTLVIVETRVLNQRIDPGLN